MYGNESNCHFKLISHLLIVESHESYRLTTDTQFSMNFIVRVLIAQFPNHVYLMLYYVCCKMGKWNSEISIIFRQRQQHSSIRQSKPFTFVSNVIETRESTERMIDYILGWRQHTIDARALNKYLCRFWKVVQECHSIFTPSILVFMPFAIRNSITISPFPLHILIINLDSAKLKLMWMNTSGRGRGRVGMNWA